MPGKHAVLSPSAAKRWIACPPSALLCKKFAAVYGESDSPYAAEGTLAHAVSELKLRHANGELNEYNFNAQYKALGEIPPEMERYTDEYVDRVLEEYYSAKRISEDAQLFVEVQLNMEPWIPGCFGTSDAVIASDKGLIVIDLKYGKGVPVDAVGNPQARIYALGAIEAFGALYDFDAIKEIIVQPRIDSVTEEQMTRDELLAWAEETVVPTARLAAKGEGEFNPGDPRSAEDHCRFCQVKALCRARVDKALDVFSNIFDSPDLLTDDALGKLLPYLDDAEKWIKDARSYATAQAMNGVTFPGYKLVRGKKPSRIWTNEDSVIDTLCIAGYTPEQFMTAPKLKSVSEMEKLLHKAAFEALLGTQVFQGEGNLTLVPESDKREAAATIELDFGDLFEN